MCKKMLAHWYNKDKWLNKTGVSFSVKEIWDGYRFKYLQWFLDPNSEWNLPNKCEMCERYVNGGECQFCGHTDNIVPCKGRGDARNIGLIGHWDGRQPRLGRVKSHSSGENKFYYYYRNIYCNNGKIRAVPCCKCVLFLLLFLNLSY